MSRISQMDLAQYVHDTLPYTELEDWDMPGIVEDMIQAWPELIGMSNVDADLHLGPNRVIDTHIYGEKYWQIVQSRQIR